MNVPNRYRNPTPARLTGPLPAPEVISLHGQRVWPEDTVTVTLAPVGHVESVDLTAHQEAFRAALALLMESDADPDALAAELTTACARLSGLGKRRAAELFRETANRLDAELNAGR